MIESKLNKSTAATLGILGGGQLAKMTALEAYKLGLNICIIEKGENSPAGDLTKMEYALGWKEKSELDKFISQCDVITLENEFIDPDILEYIEKKVPVFPKATTLRKIQDKFIQKTNFQLANIPLPVFSEINSIDDMENFANNNGIPFVIKTRTMGYDGYGNFTVKSKEDIKLAWEKLNPESKTNFVYAEKFVPFIKELAVMIARNANGDVVEYPCVETIQENHICHKVIAPANVSENSIKLAKEYARKCVEAIDGIGVFGIEMFLLENGEVLVNEIAPRPHNSGHYTIEGSFTSQFENLIRAVFNLPLGSGDLIAGAAVMINILGKVNGSPIPSNVQDCLAVKGANLHLYNKKASRIGRKMGHITSVASTSSQAEEIADIAYLKLKW